MSPLLALSAVDGVEITTIMDNSLDLLMSQRPWHVVFLCRTMASCVISYAQSTVFPC
jgi:hypothetical protein